MSLSQLKNQYSEGEPEDDVLLIGNRMHLYEGADVGAFAQGIFTAEGDKFVWHNDISGMYPGIMALCNFSPESMTLIKLKPYTGITVLTPAQVEVPDETIGKQLVIAIAPGDSISRRKLTELKALRAKYKDEASDSGQLAMKLAANSSYGYHGMKYSKYGSFLVAIATCAVGRLVMKTVKEVVAETPEVKLLENDTDGVYTYGVNIIDKVKARLDSIFSDYPEGLRIGIETKKYYGMICTGKMKNYVLRKEHRNMITGSSLKGRGMPKICEKALDDVATALFEDRDLETVWSKYMDLVQYGDIDIFEMNCDIGKDTEDYVETTMYAKLIKQAPWMQQGEELRYVRTTGGYVPLGAKPDGELLATLDRTYYQKRIKEAVSRLILPVRANHEAFCLEHLDKKPKKKKGHRPDKNRETNNNS